MKPAHNKTTVSRAWAWCNHAVTPIIKAYLKNDTATWSTALAVDGAHRRPAVSTTVLQHSVAMADASHVSARRRVGEG
jgi:hypothetical protein